MYRQKIIFSFILSLALSFINIKSQNITNSNMGSNYDTHIKGIVINKKFFERIDSILKEKKFQIEITFTFQFGMQILYIFHMKNTI